MRTKMLITAVAAVAALTFAGCSATSTPSSSSATPAPSAPVSEAAQPRQVAPSKSATTSKPTPSLKTVVAVDGDTVKLGNGQSIRIIGIDTPERGECGYDAATTKAAALIAGGVTLSKPSGHDNTDHYNRLLRYVTTKNGQDVGTVLIKSGLANARYDSTDGYDYHPKQGKYRQLSQATAHKCPTLDAENPKTPAPKTKKSTGGTSSNCDTNYGGTCVPISSSDLNCSDISGSVTVKGSDPHRFDADGDGIGCESN